MATESPTRMMSTPASSAMRAPGASYAVTITSGGSLPLRARTPGAVTGFADGWAGLEGWTCLEVTTDLLPSSAWMAAGGEQECTGPLRCAAYGACL